MCGAFGENGARAVIEATENKLPIGYVTHLPEQFYYTGRYTYERGRVFGLCCGRILFQNKGNCFGGPK
ncbi:MAG: DUF6506 family protein [Lachnospira sp.]